jgi:peptide/nickel transport system substrate-binding protein
MENSATLTEIARLSFGISLRRTLDCQWYQKALNRSSKIRNLVLTLLSLANFVDFPFIPHLGSTVLFAKGSSVVVAWDAEPRTFDPRYAQDANSQYLENLLHCSLIEYGVQGEKKPSLATQWTWLNPTTLEVLIRTDVLFSNQKPVTNKDVAATYGFFLESQAKVPSPRKNAFVKLKSVKPVGTDKVVFELQEPDAAFDINLIVGILPEDLARQDLITDPTKIVGCGPFILNSHSSSQLALHPAPQWKLDTPPKFNELLIKIVKDENTRHAKLVTGELDIVQNLINRDKLEEIEKKYGQLRVLKRSGLTTTYLGLNMRDPILKDQKVRKALALGIDRAKIIKHALKGMAQPAKTLLLPDDPFYNKELIETPFDPNVAMALLDEAGFRDPDGAGPKPRLSLSYKTTTDLTRVLVAKAIASDLKKIGVDVKVESLEWGRFKADVDQGKVQLWSLTWIGFKDPDIYRFAFATESFPPNGGNRGWYSRSDLDLLLSQAKAENNPKKRADAYFQAQKIISEDLPYIFLWHEDIFVVVNNRIKNFELYADGRLASLTKLEVAP